MYCTHLLKKICIEVDLHSSNLCCSKFSCTILFSSPCRMMYSHVTEFWASASRQEVACLALEILIKRKNHVLFFTPFLILLPRGWCTSWSFYVGSWNGLGNAAMHRDTITFTAPNFLRSVWDRDAVKPWTLSVCVLTWERKALYPFSATDSRSFKSTCWWT